MPDPLEGLKGILPEEQRIALARELSGLSESESVSKALGNVHVYANGDTGSDSNAGTSPTDAMKTISAALALLPDVISDRCCLHLAGTFDVGRVLDIEKTVAQWGYLLIDGGDDIDILSGPHTADISSTSTIGLTGVGWTIDEHHGYYVEVLTGPAAGEVRTIFSHTADTITVGANWSTDPGAAQFRIYQPATVITSSDPSYSWIYTRCFGSPVFFQRLRVSGLPYLANFSAYAGMIFAQVIINSTGGGPSVVCTGGSVEHQYAFLDPDTFVWDYNIYAAPFYKSGPLQVDNSELYLYDGTFTVPMTFTNCFFESLLEGGARVKGAGIVINDCAGKTGGWVFWGSAASYAGPVIDDAPGVGLTINNSVIPIWQLEINGSGSHAIEVNSSKVFHEASRPLAGSGNAGAGAYVHSKGTFQTKAGTTPTITGTVGDVSIDGASEESTWAGIEAGTAIDASTVGNGDFVLVKKV